MEATNATDNISIKISNLAYGNEDIEISINGKKLFYSAGYCGSDPLGDLIKIAAELDSDEDCKRYKVVWDGEPGQMEFVVTKDAADNRILHINARVTGDFFDPEERIRWSQDDKYHFKVSLVALKEAVINEAIRVLKEYGIRGYAGSWCDGWDTFLITSLLVLLGDKSKFDEETDSYRSDVFRELELLANRLKR